MEHAALGVEHAALAYDVYDRWGPKPWKTLTKRQKLRIKKALNSFKRDEMPVHAGSVKFTPLLFHRLRYGNMHNLHICSRI